VDARDAWDQRIAELQDTIQRTHLTARNDIAREPAATMRTDDVERTTPTPPGYLTRLLPLHLREHRVVDAVWFHALCFPRSSHARIIAAADATMGQSFVAVDNQAA
jgi:hypothetical protein